jgi:hypothetical protein
VNLAALCEIGSCVSALLVAAVVAASWPPELHISTRHLDVGGRLKQICSAAAVAAEEMNRVYYTNAVLRVLVAASNRSAAQQQQPNRGRVTQCCECLCWHLCPAASIPQRCSRHSHRVSQSTPQPLARYADRNTRTYKCNIKPHVTQQSLMPVLPLTVESGS